MNLPVGIDAMSFYTSRYYLDLQTLAYARNIEPSKFYIDLGQRKMAIAPPDEDIVTLAANAAANVLTITQNQDKSTVSDIALLLFATESGVDASKAAGMYIHKLLNLPFNCRVVELKQACYSATAGLQLALPFLRQNPHKRVLLIASDVARYALSSAAESSQGCGAVAMLLAAHPQLLMIEPESGVCTKEVMDFWRPNYCDVALVDGGLSCDAYLKMLQTAWQEYQVLSGRTFNSHKHFCYHTPIPKLVERAHRRLAKLNGRKVLSTADIETHIGASLIYGREIGNVYTGSLYLSIVSLLENTATDLTGCRIGLYSYGSGSEAEYFSGVVVDNYRNATTQRLQQLHRDLLAKRQELSCVDYENFHRFKLPQNGEDFLVPQHKTGNYRLEALKQHKRIYKQNTSQSISSITTH